MQGNLDKALQYEHLSSEGRFVELDEPGAACIASIDNDNTGDPQRSTMDKTNSLGKMFQRLRSSSKKYHINNASTIGELDESIASPDSIEGIPKFSQLEKTNSLGKIFQRMRSSDKKVQQKRPSSAVCDSSSKATPGFQNFFRGIWPKDTKNVADEIAVTEKFEEVNINEIPSVNNAIDEAQNAEK